MTHREKVDFDQVARAQALLLNRRELTPAALVTAYRTVRGATPGAYTEKFVEALISHGYALSGQDRMARWAEAAEVVREAAEADVRITKLAVEVLDTYQRGLSDVGRREEALEVCREMARAGRRGYEAGVVPCPTFGSKSLATRLAEEGGHAEAAELFGAIVHDERREAAGKDFWARIAWIAELDAAGEHPAARDALRTLIEEDRRHAEGHTGPYAFVVWESLLLASMEREQGRDREAEDCDRDTEVLLAALAAEGEPKNWSNILGWWAVLAGLTGRRHDRPAHGEPEAPLFAGLGWSPDIRRRYLEEGRNALGAEIARLAGPAEREPGVYLGRLVELQRVHTLRSVKYWESRKSRIPDELRDCFDEGVRLARRLADGEEPRGRAALARALADRTGMHVAARDFPPAWRDFQQARLVAAGGPLDESNAAAEASLTA